MFDNYPNNGSGTNPIGNTPQGRPSADDIFADLEKSAGVAGQPMMNNQAALNRQPQFQAQQQAQPLRPMMQQPTSPVPASSGGSLKYLIIGLVTLVILLGAGVYVYQVVLAPKIKTVETNQVVDNQIVSSTLSTENTNTVDVATLSELMTTTTTATTSPNDLVNAISPDTATSTVPSSDLTVKIPDIDKADTDGDGLTDREELKYGTDATKIDTDMDSLTDGDEINVWHTDPLKADTDGDSYKDGEEVKNGYDPKGKGKLPVTKTP